MITLVKDTNVLEVVFDAIDGLSDDIQSKLEKRNVSFRSVSFIAISADFQTYTKTHTLGAASNDPGTIRNTVHELARHFFNEHPVTLRLWRQ